MSRRWRQNAGMTNIVPPTSPPLDRSSLESCQAVIVGLGLRRFVVVRREGPPVLRQVEPKRERVRDLQPGDEVPYKGRREVVRSLQVFD